MQKALITGFITLIILLLATVIYMLFSNTNPTPPSKKQHRSTPRENYILTPEQNKTASEPIDAAEDPERHQKWHCKGIGKRKSGEACRSFYPPFAEDQAGYESAKPLPASDHILKSPPFFPPIPAAPAMAIPRKTIAHTPSAAANSCPLPSVLSKV